MNKSAANQRGRRGSLFKERQSLPSPQIAFLGDSIMARYLIEGRPIWDTHYSDLHIANFGTIGDSTQMLIEKLEKDDLPLQETQSIVLMIGATDLRHRIRVPVVYDQIRKIVMLLQANCRPGVKILVLGILPRGDDMTDCNAAIQETNEMLSQMENGFTVRWMDLWDKFVVPVGKIKTELYNSDRINLSVNGYQVLAEGIAHVFEEIQQK